MALSYDQITAITQKKFIPKLYDNIFQANPLLERAKKKGWYEKLDGGEKIVVPLNYAQNSASDWYEGADTLSTVDNETITAAEYDWKQIYGNITITRRDELKNSGDSQILKFVKSKTQIAEKTLADKLSTGMYSDGTTAKQIVGLRAIVDDASTVGGIAQGTYSWWQSQVDSSTTTLTLAAMQAIFNDASVGSDTPTFLIGDRDNYDRFYNLLTPQQRFVDSESAKAGFTSIMFNGKPFLVDAHAPSGDIFFLNEKYLHLFVHKQEDMRFDGFIKPTNQNVRVGKIFWMGAMGSSNNRMHGLLDAIAA